MTSTRGWRETGRGHLLPGLQELLDEGRAAPVLEAAGRALRRLQDQVPGLVHGDCGPQNLLLEPRTCDVVAVLDGEFAHQGEAVEDVARAEWIVRMHHPGAVQHRPAGALPAPR